MVAVHLVSFTVFAQFFIISKRTLMLGQCWRGIAVGGNSHTAGDLIIQPDSVQSHCPFCYLEMERWYCSQLTNFSTVAQG